MKKKYTLLWGLFGAALCFTGCSQDEVLKEVDQPDESLTNQWGISEEDMIKGRMRVKFKEEPGKDANFISKMRSVGVVRMERTFPPAGKFEERTRREGLHLWYDVWLDKERSFSRSATNFSLFDEVDQVAPVVKVEDKAVRAVDQTFNDPLLPKQWFYHNEGTEPWQLKGADIGLYEAWKTCTGDPSIIVSLVDTGIECTHPDLNDNMWVNRGEIPGNGIDDDNNGYIDDIYGYNFVDMNANITVGDHGTHVAGLLAATNHNGLGVCGVAGGDGTPNSGVKMMNCQILGESAFGGEILSQNIGAAIKYGADNGAVISQNSWGYAVTKSRDVSYIDPTHKAAIDYFIKYAGCDNEGNQLPDSPMKGGLVLFASGNKNTSDPRTAAPADYEPVIGVAALGADFTKTSYSNYGEYIDICAPGGLITSYGRMLSTVPEDDGLYGEKSGTSMSCPLVSGVAALIIQQQGVGKPGLTPEKVKQILYESATDISAYNPTFEHQLGAGCVNAAAALSNGEVKPDINSEEPVVLYTKAIADGKLVFSVSKEVAGAAQVSIYSSMGTKVFEKVTECKPYVRTTLNVSNLSAGYYLFELKTVKGTWKYQFIKY